jgi:hypothetical protein
MYNIVFINRTFRHAFLDIYSHCGCCNGVKYLNERGLSLPLSSSLNSNIFSFWIESIQALDGLFVPLTNI